MAVNVFKNGTAAALALALVLSFQNCSQTSFVSDGGDASMKTEATDDVSPGMPEDDPDQQVVTQDLVECQLLSANAKITLNQDLEIGSNDQDTRICMSRKSCLQLINKYAADRDCSLAEGAATSAGAKVQCTQIFPGSQGTCHNAQTLSEDEVGKFLAEMAK